MFASHGVILPVNLLRPPSLTFLHADSEALPDAHISFLGFTFPSSRIRPSSSSASTFTGSFFFFSSSLGVSFSLHFCPRYYPNRGSSVQRAMRKVGRRRSAAASRRSHPPPVSSSGDASASCSGVEVTGRPFSPFLSFFLSFFVFTHVKFGC